MSTRRTPARAADHLVQVPAGVRRLLVEIGRLAHAQQLHAYAVGGCVRDWRFGRARTVDVDVVVEGDGVAFAQQLAMRWGAPLTAHAQFGTATLQVTVGRRVRRLDVATCRKETYAAPAAYPRVTPGTLRDDLFRRDFTINAMAMSVAPETFGCAIDPFGGLRDLRAKRLRILHPKSFIDDPSRILRAARFAPRFGLRLEDATAVALERAVADGLLARLNQGRIRKELAQMLQEPRPVACARLLEQWLQGRVRNSRRASRA